MKSKNNSWLLSLLLIFTLGTQVSAQADEVILGKDSYWRVFNMARTPLVRVKKGAELTEELQSSSSGSSDVWKVEGPPPPAEWAQPEFSDHSWHRVRSFGSGVVRGLLSGKYFSKPESSISFSPTLALQCVRGKFQVPTGRAKGLRLSISYRGGVVVYVNGKELARNHMPKGELTETSLADEYPVEAFATFKGRKVTRGDNNLRTRKFEVDVPARMLKKGSNVIAFEIHRAPYFGPGLRREGYNTKSVWATCGLASVQLTAESGVEAHAKSPSGIQVWNSPTTEWVTANSRANSADTLEAIELVGVRNGTFAGQVVVRSGSGLSGVKGAASALQLKGGKGLIPAANVQVLYSTPSPWLNQERKKLNQGTVLWDTLTAVAPAKIQSTKGGGAVLPVWVRVQVPEDAKGGDYEGKLTIQAKGLKPVVIPINLKVINWKLPDSKDFVTHMGLIQSPDSVALMYNVPLWSEKHWELMEESFKLMGELGNKTIWLPLIARTNFGNEQSMVRYIKDGTGWKYDFTVFDRYLDLTQKYLKPDVVCVYVWDNESANTFSHARPSKVAENQKWKGTPVTGWDPKTKKAKQILAPKLDAPEAKAFWVPVLKEVQARLKKRGLWDATMIGMVSEWVQPSKEMKAMLGGEDFLPGREWIIHTHDGDISGLREGYYVQVYIRNYSTLRTWEIETHTKVKVSGRIAPRAWRRPGRQDWFCRGFYPQSSLTDHRTLLERSFMHNLTGWGRIGIDLWPLGIDAGHSPGTVGSYMKNTTTVASRYPETDWGQNNVEHSGTMALVAPGPNGALRTVRFEAVRTGLQECEARIFLDKALLDPAVRTKLGTALVEKCEALLLERVWALKSGGGDLDRLSEKLFQCAAEVAAKQSGK